MEGVNDSLIKDLMVIGNRLIVTNIRNPFDPFNSREIKEFPIGLTIQECIDAMVPVRDGYEYVVSLNGSLLDPSIDFLITKPIGSLAICAVPQGQGGGKDVLRIVAMIAILVIAVVTENYELIPALKGMGFAAETIQVMSTMYVAAVMIAGSLLVNALLPMSTPDMNGAAGDFSQSATYGWQAAGNSNREGVVFPVLYGTCRITPPIISKYVEVLEDKQYMNILYGIADHGITSISNTSVRINENLVTKGEEGIDWETRLGELSQSPIQYFGDTRTAKMEGKKISGTWTKVDLDGDAIEGLGVALVLPNGLFYAANDGTLAEQTVDIDIEYRKYVVGLGDEEGWIRREDYNSTDIGYIMDRWSAGCWDSNFQKWVEIEVGSTEPNDHREGDLYPLPMEYWYNPVPSDPVLGRTVGEWRWLGVESIYSIGTLQLDHTQITGAQSTSIRKVFYRDHVITGSYQIRVRFHDGIAPPSTSRYSNAVYLEYTETILYDDFEYPDTALFGLRALATDKYSGGLPSCDFIAARSTVPVWTGSAYEYLDANNPAWAAYDILHNSTYGGGVPYSRIVYADFAIWAAFCVSKGFTCNIYFDTGTSLRKALNMIGLLGRGSVVQLGSIFTCFVDKEVTIPAQCFMFNVGNIIARSFRIDYMDSSERANAIDVIYWDKDDYYTQKTIEVHAIDFDSTTQEVKKASLSLIGCTDRPTALKHAFFFLNNNRLLTITANWNADIDAIGCLPWDVIEVQHDVTLWGEGGRIVSAIDKVITLDKTISLTSGVTYTLSFIDSDEYDLRQQRTIVGPGIVTFTAVDDKVNRVAHGVSNGTLVSFPNEGEVLAEPLIRGVLYYVRDATADYFKLAATSEGDVIDLTTDGSGTITLKIEEAVSITVETIFSPEPALHDLWTISAVGQETKFLRILRINREDDLTCKIEALEYNPDVYDDSGTLEPPEAPAAIVFVDNLRATEVWTGFVGTNIIISWTGFATNWYVKYKVASSSTWVLLGSTSIPNMLLKNPSYGIEYTISVSPTQKVLDGKTVTITPTGKVAVDDTDGSGMIIDGDGIRIYSSDPVLGPTLINFPSNGSQQILNSPKIKLQTAGAVQTADGIGDGITNAAGVYICKDGIYACQEGQTLANANVRILATGSAYFAGAISASTIDIGGADATSFHVDVNGNLWAGAADFNIATNPFAVSNTGVLHVISGGIDGTLEVGSGDPHIHIDGANARVVSSNYVSGIFGTGFLLSPNLLEVGNIAARGILRSSVFQKDVVSAIGGNLAVLPADVLTIDMTANEGDIVVRITEDGNQRITEDSNVRILAEDFALLEIEGNETFFIDDILRIKDGIDDEWLKVISIAAAPAYGVTRDLAAAYSIGANPAWKKGASIINYRQSGSGGIYMTASETNAPYLSIFTHAGAPWSSITTRLRLGNLNGYLGYSTDTYGIGIGDTSGSLRYDPTNGFRIMAGQTAYNTGSGFYVGYVGGKWVLSIGNPAGDYLYWDGTNLVLNGSASLVGTLPWSSITNDGHKPADDATIGAIWGTNLTGIPAGLGTPSGSGLFLSANYMGYYAGGAWKTYIDNNGNMVLGDVGASHGISWNQTTGQLTIKGAITILSGAVPNAVVIGLGALALLGSADFATQVSGAAKPSNNADVTSANIAAGIAGQGALATVSSADFATQVSGAAKPANNADVTLAVINGGLAVTGGGIILSGGGSIKGGQTDYNTGTGFFLGYSGAAYKFSVGNSTQYLNFDGTNVNVGGDIIATGNIKDNAVTIPVSAYTDGDVTITSEATVQSLSITTHGSPVYISYSYTLRSNGAAFLDFTTYDLRLYRGTTLIQEITGLIGFGGGYCTIKAGNFSETPAAGTYTYALKAVATYASSIFKARSLFAIEMRK
jgi:hypothetical protein